MDKKKDEEAGKEKEHGKSDDPSTKERSNPKETAPPGPKDLRTDKEVPLGFNLKLISDLGSRSQDTKDFQTLKA